MTKNSCFHVHKHIAEIHESEALNADYLNIGYYTNFSERYMITCVEGDAVEHCDTKYLVMLFDSYTAKLLTECHVNTVAEVKRVGICMVKNVMAIGAHSRAY